MSLRSEGNFLLGQKINRDSSMNNLGANETVGNERSNVYRESLLCIDETVLNSIDFDKFEYVDDSKKLPVINDVEFDSFHYHDKSNEHNYSKIKEYAHLDYANFDNDSNDEDDVPTTAKNPTTLNDTGRDSGINKSEWEDDSLLDQVFSAMNSSDYLEFEKKQQERKRSPLADVDLNNIVPEVGASEDVKSTKRKDALSPLKENRPLKKSRVAIDSFYGLPNRVKELIQRVKGIDELYGNSSVWNFSFVV